MQLSERHVDGIAVIDVAGDLTMAADPCGLKEFVKERLQRGERRIVLNMANLKRVDSTCLGEIIISYTSTAMHGGTLKLAQPNPQLQRLLEVTKLETVIGVFASEAEAIASFGTPASGRVPTP